MLLSMMINVHGISIYHCILHQPEDKGKGKKCERLFIKFIFADDEK